MKDVITLYTDRQHTQSTTIFVQQILNLTPDKSTNDVTIISLNNKNISVWHTISEIVSLIGAKS